jgi:hypothetical protein
MDHYTRWPESNRSQSRRLGKGLGYIAGVERCAGCLAPDIQQATLQSLQQSFPFSFAPFTKRFWGLPLTYHVCGCIGIQLTRATTAFPPSISACMIPYFSYNVSQFIPQTRISPRPSCKPLSRIGDNPLTCSVYELSLVRAINNPRQYVVVQTTP